MRRAPHISRLSGMDAMGLGRGELDTLIYLRKAGHDIVGTGAVMELGAQQLSNNFLESRDALAELAELLGVTKPCPLPTPLPARVFLDGGHEHLDDAAPRAKDFWEWLGYRYACIDVDGSPGSVPIDLNYDGLPTSEMSKYQIVTNCGTTEHLVNQLNAFKVVHDLTAVGGIMIHNLPAQGYLSHGFVHYNPQFFWTLAHGNVYEVMRVDFSVGDYYPMPKDIIDSLAQYSPYLYSRLTNFQAADCGLFFALKKTRDAPYVAPFDLHTGARQDKKLVKEHYSAMLRPESESSPSSYPRLAARWALWLATFGVAYHVGRLLLDLARDSAATSIAGFLIYVIRYAAIGAVLGLAVAAIAKVVPLKIFPTTAKRGAIRALSFGLALGLFVGYSQPVHAQTLVIHREIGTSS